MSKPVLEDLFAFHGRRNRKSFNLYTFVLAPAYLIVVIFAVVALSAMLGVSSDAPAAGEAGTSPMMVLLMMVGLFPLSLSSWAVTTQRLRDTDLSGWFALLNLIPFVNMVLAIYCMVRKGTEGENTYGPDPRY